MDDAPRATLKGLVIATGLLIFVGAGCSRGAALSTDEAWRMSGIHFDKLVFEDDAGHTYVQGVSVCSLENAKILFAHDIDWEHLDQVLERKSGEGWNVERFCFDQKHGAAFILTKRNSNKDVDGAQFILGGGQSSIVLSEPFSVDEGGVFSEKGWDLLGGAGRITATVSGNNLAFDWVRSFAMDVATQKVKETHVCAEHVYSIPKNMNIKVPQLCN